MAHLLGAIIGVAVSFLFNYLISLRKEVKNLKQSIDLLQEQGESYLYTINSCVEAINEADVYRQLILDFAGTHLTTYLSNQTIAMDVLHVEMVNLQQIAINNEKYDVANKIEEIMENIVDVSAQNEELKQWCYTLTNTTPQNEESEENADTPNN